MKTTLFLLSCLQDIRYRRHVKLYMCVCVCACVCVCVCVCMCVCVKQIKSFKDLYFLVYTVCVNKLLLEGS